MKLETRYKKTKCIDGCELFNDEKSYSYWENKKETLDEIEILDFLNSNHSSNSFKILHVGIGNSYIANNLNKYSGHSLRSGFATSAAELGAEERSIMAMTGHKTSQMVRRYIQEANLFKNNALNKIKI